MNRKSPRFSKRQQCFHYIDIEVQSNLLAAHRLTQPLLVPAPTLSNSQTH